jgi:uncharacterized protein (TIGR02246 family)
LEVSIAARATAPTIEDAFADWTAALASGDAGQVAALYAHDAVLVPTFAPDILRGPKEISRYFSIFLKGGPRCSLLEGVIQTMGDVAVHSGIYRFTLTALDGEPQVDARFTFVYQRRGEAWRVVAHHSSVTGEA